MRSKFKVGDKVRCIVGTTEHEGHGLYGGHGWEKGLEIIVDRIRDHPDCPIIWSRDGDGIYEDWLELADEPKQTKARRKQVPKRWRL